MRQKIWDEVLWLVKVFLVCICKQLWHSEKMCKNWHVQEYSKWNNKKQRQNQEKIMGGVGTYIIPEEDIIHPVGEGLLLHKHTLLLQPFDVIFFKFTIHGDLRNKKFQWEGQYWRVVLGQLQTMLYPIYIGNPISTKFNTTPSIILISFSLYFALYIRSSLFLLKMFSLLNCISTV